MIRAPHLPLILLLLSACGEKPQEMNQHAVALPKDTFVVSGKSRIDSVLPVPVKLPELETRLCSLGLVNIHSLDSTIKVNLKYSTPDNFIGIDVYGEFNQCYLQPDVAEKLAMAEKFLREKYPFYSLIVFDAVRPLSIQQKMWDTLVLPPGEKIKYLSNPKNFSLHNYGAAVDLSIIDENGIQLDMGTPFDFFGEKAHPVKEQELLASGELTEREISNREILRGVMHKAGFFGIQTEWWHFNSCTREVAATKYQIVR